MERYFLEPYRFVPPFRGTFWCGVARRVIPRHLRRKMGVLHSHYEGLEHLRDALDQKAGILLAANHCRWADPMVLGVMASQVRQYLYYVTSYHLFRQSRVMGWLLNRIGGYSIWREGSDRESIRVSARILADAERPVVLFPEGTWFRQNDRIAPLQEGLSLITRQAAKLSDRPILVLPVGIKYWMLQDPRPEVERRLDRLERRLGWHPQKHLDLVGRLDKLGSGLLALKEVEYLGEARVGPLDERIAHLIGSQLTRLEEHNLGRRHDGWALERIRRLRQSLSRRLIELAESDAAVAVRKDLDDLLCLENLNAHSMSYLREDPSPERLVETIQRIEEMLSDGAEKPVVPMGVTIQVGSPINARAEGKSEALVPRLHKDMQGLVDRLVAVGPPPEWGCPHRAFTVVPTFAPPPTPTPADSQLIG